MLNYQVIWWFSAAVFFLKLLQWLYSDALNHSIWMEDGIIYMHFLLVMPSSALSISFNHYLFFLLNSVSSEPAKRNSFLPVWHYVGFYPSWIFLLFLVNAVSMNTVLYNGCVVVIWFVETMEVRWQRQKFSSCSQLVDTVVTLIPMNKFFNSYFIARIVVCFLNIKQLILENQIGCLKSPG